MQLQPIKTKVFITDIDVYRSYMKLRKATISFLIRGANFVKTLFKSGTLQTGCTPSLSDLFAIGAFKISIQ